MIKKSIKNRTISRNQHKILMHNQDQTSFDTVRFFLLPAKRPHHEQKASEQRLGFLVKYLICHDVPTIFGHLSATGHTHVYTRALKVCLASS